MYWENIIGCATMCTDCDNNAVSYLEDEGELLAEIFRSVDMKNTIVKNYYTDAAEKQININKASSETTFDEERMLWFRGLVCGDCLRKGLIEETSSQPIKLVKSREDYICDKVLVAYEGNPVVDFIDFVGSYQDRLQQMINEMADVIIEQLSPDLLQKITGKAYEKLITSNHHGINKEKNRFLELYAEEAIPMLLELLYAALEDNDEYKEIMTVRNDMYLEINKHINKYPNSLVAYFAEEDLSEVNIGYDFEGEFRSLGVHKANDIENPEHHHFFSGPYEVDMQQVKTIIRDKPELNFEWNEYDMNRFHHQILRKLQGMNIFN